MSSYSHRIPKLYKREKKGFNNSEIKWLSEKEKKNYCGKRKEAVMYMGLYMPLWNYLNNLAAK